MLTAECNRKISQTSKTELTIYFLGAFFFFFFFQEYRTSFEKLKRNHDLGEA